MQNPIPEGELNPHWITYWPRVRDAILQSIQKDKESEEDPLEEEKKDPNIGIEQDIEVDEVPAHDLSATFIDNLWAG